MRHNKKRGMKLGTDASHTKAMKKSLVGALLANDRIKTTTPRAKAIRSDVDRIITWAKRGDLHSRRLAIAKVGDAQLVGEIFSKAAQGMWDGRDGGYTRIVKLGNRKGDGAEISIIEIVSEPVAAKKAAGKTEVKKVAKKVEEPEPEAEAAEEEASAEEPAAEEAPAEEEAAEAEEQAE